MLAVPILKAVTTPVLDTSGLHRYLIGQQPHNESAIFYDITTFNELRQSAISFTEPSDVAVQQLLTYCHQVKSFSQRFTGVENELNLAFTWADGFSASKKSSLSSFYFDWACCMWNLAAFESLRGARVDRTTEEGIRTANKHFQQAAGYFEFIRENILPNIKMQTIPSLSDDSLSMAKNLMLAQAQLCFYEKAVKDKKKDLMKSAIIAKLAAQTSVFYGLASSLCKAGTLGPLLDVSWYAITDFQSKCFHGASEYWQAVAAKEAALAKGAGYGEEIARYLRAERYVSQALALSRQHNIAASLPQGAEGLLTAINANKKTAEYDLATVYMEAVPGDATLVEVVPVAMVRPSGLPDLAGSPPERLFKYVVPRELIESSRKFQEEINTIFISCQVDADNATNIGRVTLSSVGLPGSLEAVKSEVPLPEPLWHKVQRVQGMGGFDRLPGLFDDLQAGARRALASMASIDDSLSREEKADAEFRGRYPAWNGPQSATLNADIKSNCRRMRDAYSNAQTSDEIIRKELQDSSITTNLRVLSQSKEQLLRLFPQEEPNLLDFDESAGDVNAKSTAAFGPDAVRLEEKLHELAEIIETRGHAFEGIKKVSQLDFIELVSNNLGETNNSSGKSVQSASTGAAAADSSSIGLGLTAICEQHLASCREWKDTISKGIALQETLLAEILQLNTSFIKSRELSPRALKVNAVIQGLEQSIAKYFSLHGQISAGVTFYSNLQSKLTTLLQSSDDLAYTQQWQRSEFEASRSTAYDRSSQETADHEYALKLADMLNGQPQQPAQAPASQPAPPKPTSAAVPNPSEVYYGTPVNGPPTSSKPSTAYVGVQGAAGPPKPQVQPLTNNGQVTYASTASLQPPPPPPVANNPATSQYAQQPAGAQYVQQQQQQQYQQPQMQMQSQYVQPPAPQSYPQNPNLFGQQPAASQPLTEPLLYNQYQPSVPVPAPVAAPAVYNPYGATAALPAPQPNQIQQHHVQPPPPAAVQQQPPAQGGYVYNAQPAHPQAPGQYAPPPQHQLQQPAQQYYTPAAPAPAPQQQYQQAPVPHYQQPPTPQYQQQQQAPAPQYQHQPIPQQQYHQQQPQYHQPPPGPLSGGPMTPEEFNRRINTLCEMGFDRASAASALNANGGNEEAALNALLSGPTPTGALAPPPAAPAPPAAAAKESGGGGFFGKIWGSK